MNQQALFGLEQAETTSDDYYTPKWVFDALDCEFDLDVCAPPGGAPFVPAKRHFTRFDDGLVQEWKGFVWMNPPFSNPLPWAYRFVEHNNGIALVPTSQGRWMEVIWNADTAWTSLKSMKFHTPTGPAKSSLPNRCWLVAAGNKAKQILVKSNLGVVR